MENKILEMVKLKILCFFILLLSANLALSEKKLTFFDSLSIVCELKQGEYLMIHFVSSLNSCPSCSSTERRHIDCIINLAKENNIKLKNLAILDCYREVEKKYYKKKFRWNYYILCGSYEAKTKLGLDDDTIIAFYNSDGELLFTFSDKNYKQDFCKLIEYYFSK